MDKNSLLYKLGESELSWPRGLIGFVKEKKKYPKNKGYVDTLQLWKGKLLQRTFAFEHDTRNHKELVIQEVCRRLEGETSVLLCQIENYSMSGRKPYYTDDGKWITKKSKASKTYYSWYSSSAKNWWFYDWEFYNKDQWIKELNIPYCGYDSENYSYKLPFIQYVSLYRKYPKIELLAKAGLGHLISGARYLNFSGKTFEQIFKIPKFWQSHLNDLDIKDILLIRRRNPVDIEELNFLRENNQHKYIQKYMCSKMMDYIKNYNQCIGFPKYEYDDYLKFAEKLGMDMNDYKVLCPSEGVHSAHDKAEDKLEVIQSESLNKSIKEVATKLNKYKYSNNDYMIVVPASSVDFIQESRQLKHCVRQYAERVAKGETTIFFVRKNSEPDKSLYTIEFKNKQVTQFRGKGNSLPALSAKEFVAEWMKKVVKNPKGYSYTQ